MLSLVFETNQILTPPAGMGKATSILRNRDLQDWPWGISAEEVVSYSDDSLGLRCLFESPLPLSG